MRTRRVEPRWIAGALLSLALAITWPGAASAQAQARQAQPRTEKRSLARAEKRSLAKSERLVRRALRLCDRGQYARAIALLERARSLGARPLARFQLERCVDRHDEAAAASEAYRQFLEVAPDALPRGAAVAREQVGALDETAPAEDVLPAPEPSGPAEVPVSASPAPPSRAAELPLRPTLRAERTDEPPSIDGVLESQEWRSAAKSGEFRQKLPFGGLAPTDATTVQVLYDDEAIYVAFDCEQRNSPRIAQLARRDRPTESDSVSVAIDPRADGRSAFEFSVSAAGVLVDGLRFDDGKIAREWDAVWEARTAEREGGWSAELRIPLRALRFDAAASRFRIQARRYVAARQELDEWAYIPREIGGEVSHYGTLEGLQLTAAGGTFEVLPFVVGRARHRAADPRVVHEGWTLEPSAGVDFEWRPVEDLALAGTINPDFAQVEADRLILNLTNLELAFPEKRPFFLAGMDDYQTMVPIFYSRRIGRTPKRPQLALAPGERLYDDPQPAPIHGALKLTTDLDDDWTIAALSALTGANDLDAVAPDGSRAARLVDPLTSFNVLRVRREFGSSFDLGATATATLRNEPGFGWPSWLTSSASYPSAGGDSVRCPNGPVVAGVDRCFHDAFVGSLDFVWRSESGDYALRGQGYASAIAQGPTRVLADGTPIGDGDLGAGGTLRVSKQGGEHWLFDGTIAAHSRKLDLNDLGFMERQNSLRAGLYVEYRTLDLWHGLLETHTALLGYGENDLTGLALGRGLMLLETVVLENRWTFTLGGYATATRFDDREIGDGTALERTGVGGAAQSISTDPSRPFVVSAQLSEEGFAGGLNLNAQVSVVWQPSAATELQLVPSYALASGEPRYAGLGAIPGELVFGRLHAESAGLTLRAAYGFLPSLTLQTYVQLFLARGRYTDYSRFFASAVPGRLVLRRRDLASSDPPPLRPDFQQASLALNVVLRWEYRLGSTLYLLYLRSQDPDRSLAPGSVPRLDPGILRRAPATDVLMLKLSHLFY